MGIGFVIVFHLIILSIISSVVALIILLFSYLFGYKNNLLIKITKPFIFIFSLYFFLLIGSICVSIIKDVDIGIGDNWYVPLSKNTTLNFIDTTEYGFIQNSKNNPTYQITNIGQEKNIIYGETKENSFFTYDLNSNKSKEYGSINEVINDNKTISQPNMEKVDTFYFKKKKEIAGIWLYFIGFISLIGSILLTFGFRVFVAINKIIFG